ncbi:MAG: acylphosphatase [Gemmatimonadales bacterium]
MPTWRFVVEGMVQGVGFRYFVRRRALELGLAGSVRNLPDGRVEVLASGEREPTDHLEAALWRGPSMARVTNVSRFEIKDDIGFRSGFAIDG